MRPAPAVDLCNDTLGRLPGRISVPSYDRAALQPGVVHISVGSFHRSHQAVYLDDLAQQGERAWGIVGVGLRRRALSQALAPQDGLYSVVARGATGSEARVIGAMSRYLYAPHQEEAVLDALADERTALATLTITAGAYAPAASSVEPGVPADVPVSAIAYLLEGLDRRRRAGRAPFTVLSCDNLPDNGEEARRAVLELARSRDPSLASWIEEQVEFPNSMVDRITPRTTAQDQADVAREFGVRDHCPVITEPFSQWVIEDRFCNRRPPLEDVGAQFVGNVAPYALMKTRLLNASHCAIGSLGLLAGMRRTDEVMRDPVLRSYVRRLMQEEVAPLLPPVPGIDLEAYIETLLARLANPRIGDELQRLSRAGSSKFPAHVLPSIAGGRVLGTETELLTIAVAGWIHHLRGVDENGERLTVDDPRAADLRALAASAGHDPRPLLADRSLFADLGDDSGFAAALRRALTDIGRLGVRGAIVERLATDRTLAA